MADCEFIVADPITGTKTLTPRMATSSMPLRRSPMAVHGDYIKLRKAQRKAGPRSFPLSATSTGFNADFKTAEQMGVEQGLVSYLGDPERCSYRNR